ncbi:hypothetical protein IEE94_08165 [Yimella sp. cx-573]|nr:hypothetical protein [Yimella sp. cx-573]
MRPVDVLHMEDHRELVEHEGSADADERCAEVDPGRTAVYAGARMA